jgi:hypothetical protein
LAKPAWTQEPRLKLNFPLLKNIISVLAFAFAGDQPIIYADNMLVALALDELQILQDLEIGPKKS